MIDTPKRWISEAADYPDDEYFKAKDKQGNVYRVMNPAKVKPWSDSKGRVWVTRPKPVLIEKATKKSSGDW